MKYRIVAAPLLTALTVVVLVACGNGKEETSKMPGKAVFDNYNCAQCHGAQGEGSKLAPAIDDLGEHFTKSQLIEYLKNPMEYAKQDPRLSEQKEGYPSMMPNYEFIGEEKLSDLADYLLAAHE